MSEDDNRGPQIIEFRPKAMPPVHRGGDERPTRDQLVTMIRKVLSTSELFKMNAPKSRKRSGSVEVIQFELPARIEEGNGSA